MWALWCLESVCAVEFLPALGVVGRLAREEQQIAMPIILHLRLHRTAVREGLLGPGVVQSDDDE